MSISTRVTQRSINTTVVRNLQASLERTRILQEQLSSGRVLSKPSDGPAATDSAMRYRADLARARQLDRNIHDGLDWLTTADTTLVEGLDVLGRARELTLRAANSTTGPGELTAIAEELEGLRGHMLALANTTYLDRPIFGGTSGATQAYDPTTGAFLGDAGAVMRSVGAGVSVQVNVGGADAFGAPGADVFAVLADVIDHVRAGDRASLSNADITALEGASTQMQDAIAAVGARYHQIDVTRTRNDERIDGLVASLSEVENVDLPATIVALQLQEVSYQAALGATARVIQPSLVDFLR